MTKELEQHNELLALYQNTVLEIAHNKILPWKLNVANTIVTGFLIILIGNIRFNCCLDCFFPFIFASVIGSFTFTFFTCFLIGNCFDRVKSCRATLTKIYKKFGSDFNGAIDNKNPEGLDFGDIALFAASLAFPIFLLTILIIFCTIK